MVDSCQKEEYGLLKNIEFAADELKGLLGPAAICTDPNEIGPYLVDERGIYSGESALMVRPDSTRQVSKLLAYCNQHRIGVVPQGGNTGYCGASIPFSASHILLRLDRLNSIRSLNPLNYSATFEAGVGLAQAHEAVASHELYFPLRMGSEGSCQIGGAISTNAGGLNVIRYGNTRDLVLGLEIVLPNGTILDTALGLRKDNTGLRYMDLFVGAEGTLGIITAATVKLFPRLKGYSTALLAATNVKAICDLLGHFRMACDDNIVAYELITQDSGALAGGLVDVSDLFAGSHAGPMLLVEAVANHDQRAQGLLESALEKAMEAEQIVDGVVAQSMDQAARLWRFREIIPEAEKLAGGSIKNDVSLPVDRIPEFVITARENIDAIAACRYSIFGHIGDGNLHYNVLAPEDADAADWKYNHQDQIAGIVAELAESMGGSFSAEHGIGVLKKSELHRWRPPEALALMAQLKNLFDPNDIMNPGKML